MAYVLQNKLEVSVFFDDKEYPLNEYNLLNYLLIVENAVSLAPTLALGLVDQSQILKTVNLLDDACRIRIVIRSHDGDENTYRFRLFKSTKSPKASGDEYEIHGYFDSVQYWLGRETRSLNTTSSQAIQQIASACGLDTDIETTQDKQLWLPVNRTNAAFVKYISKSGWKDSTSFMVCGLNAQGKLLYKDITKPKPVKARFNYGDFRDGLIPVVQHQPMTVSGLNNMGSGYKSNRFPQRVSGTNEVIDKLSFTPDSSQPLFNQQVREQVAAANKFGRICFGNVHTNREKAVYQNQRYASLYSYGDALLTPIQVKNVTLFDNINFTAITQADTSEDIGYSGNLIVTAKAIYIEGTNYMEKYQGVRHGTNQER